MFLKDKFLFKIVECRYFQNYLLVSLTTEIKNLDNFGWKIENEAQCKSRTGEKLLEYLSRNIQILELWQY